MVRWDDLAEAALRTRPARTYVGVTDGAYPQRASDRRADPSGTGTCKPPRWSLPVGRLQLAVLGGDTLGASCGAAVFP